MAAASSWVAISSFSFLPKISRPAGDFKSLSIISAALAWFIVKEASRLPDFVHQVIPAADGDLDFVRRHGHSSTGVALLLQRFGLGFVLRGVGDAVHNLLFGVGA